jgi:putative Holliday junction resolvase
VTGRLIGVDHGTVRVGLAVCDAGRRVATPLHTYKRRTPDKDADYFARLAVAESAVGWVVGLPLHMSGDEGEKAKECRAFGDWLAGVSGLPVVYHDERYTSAAAEEAMALAGLSPKQRKDRLDKVAAQLILQAYLDANQPPPPAVPADHPES